jgi:hypothetical protein
MVNKLHSYGLFPRQLKTIPIRIPVITNLKTYSDDSSDLLTVVISLFWNDVIFFSGTLQFKHCLASRTEFSITPMRLFIKDSTDFVFRDTLYALLSENNNLLNYLEERKNHSDSHFLFHK